MENQTKPEWLQLTGVTSKSLGVGIFAIPDVTSNKFAAATKQIVKDLTYEDCAMRATFTMAFQWIPYELDIENESNDPLYQSYVAIRNIHTKVKKNKDLSYIGDVNSDSILKIEHDKLQIKIQEIKKENKAKIFKYLGINNCVGHPCSSKKGCQITGCLCPATECI